MKTNFESIPFSYNQIEKEVEEILSDREKQNFILSLKKVHDDYMRRERLVKPLYTKPKNNFRIYLTAIAAVMVLFIGIAGIIRLNMFSSVSNYEDIFDKYYQAYPIVQQNRSIESGDEENIVNMAISAYEKKEFYRAISLFNSIETSMPDCTIMASFYKGISSIEISDYKSAIQAFNKVIDAPFNSYTSSAHWYIALTWIKLNNIEESKKHLIWIVKNDRQNSKKAEEILSEIEK